VKRRSKETTYSTKASEQQSLETAI